jgi:hypothetical protein
MNDLNNKSDQGGVVKGEKEFDNLTIFKPGDYTEFNNPVFTKEDNSEIVKRFRRDHETKNKTIPLILSTTPGQPHNLEGAVKLGEMTDLYLYSGGVIAGSGKYNDGCGDIFEKFKGRSAGFIKDEENPDKWLLDHVAITAADAAVIQDLIPNNQVLFAKSQVKEAEIYIPFEDQPGGKEVNNMTEKKKEPETATFSKSELDARITEAVKRETANFATEIAELKKTNETLKKTVGEKDGIIEAGKKTIENLEAQVAEFAKSKESEAHEALKGRVYALEGLGADKKEPLIERLANYAKDGQHEIIEEILKGYEDMTATRKKDNAEFAKLNKDEKPKDKPLLAFRVEGSGENSQVVTAN